MHRFNSRYYRVGIRVYIDYVLALHRCVRLLIGGKLFHLFKGIWASCYKRFTRVSTATLVLLTQINLPQCKSFQILFCFCSFFLLSESLSSVEKKTPSARLLPSVCFIAYYFMWLLIAVSLKFCFINDIYLFEFGLSGLRIDNSSLTQLSQSAPQF